MLDYALVGLALGSIYAIASAGLVVTYASSGVLNFAFGSMACGSHDTEQRALAATPNGAQSTRTADAPLTWEVYLSLPSVSAFAWAPSGTRIAYVASEEGKSSIYIVDAVSGAPRRLVDGASPQWSPDGSRIAYLAQGDVWTVPAAGGTPTISACRARPMPTSCARRTRTRRL